MTINAEPTTESKTFEINLLVRDSNGNPTGRRKSFATDDSGKLWEFWMKHQGRPKRKPRSKKKRIESAKQLPKAQEADKILNELYKGREDNR